MKDLIQQKLIEFGYFIICIVIVLAIARFSGFLEGFAPQDFQNAYQNIVYNVDGLLGKKSNNVLDSSNSKSNRIASYRGYQPMRIPVAVLRGVDSSNTWQNIFYADKKVVFYVYDNSQNEFNNTIQNYLSTKSKMKNYALSAYTQGRFDNIRAGEIGPSKICNSLAECNAVRQKASDYSALAEFMKRCGTYICIINPQKQQYVRLRSKNSSQAVKMINALSNW